MVLARLLWLLRVFGVSHEFLVFVMKLVDVIEVIARFLVFVTRCTNVAEVFATFTNIAPILPVTTSKLTVGFLLTTCRNDDVAPWFPRQLSNLPRYTGFILITWWNDVVAMIFGDNLLTFAWFILTTCWNANVAPWFLTATFKLCVKKLFVVAKTLYCHEKPVCYRENTI